MEGRVHFCRWTRSAQGIHIWLDSDPRKYVKCKNVDVAVDKLKEIRAVTADGEAQLEVADIPLEAMEPAISVVLAISGQAGAHGPVMQPNLFTQGYCPYCDAPLGNRTSVPALFTELPDADGAQNWTRGGNQLFSDRFLALLSDEERSALSFVLVEGPAPKGRTFYELAGPCRVPFVAAKKYTPSSTKCEGCGQFRIFYLPPSGSPYFWCIAQSNLPDKLPGCFVCGEQGNLQLCFTAGRWAQLVGKPGTSQLRSGCVGVLAADAVDPDPALEVATTESFLRMKRKSNR